MRMDPAVTDCPECGKDVGFELDGDDWHRIGEEHVCPHCRAMLVVAQGSYVSIVDGSEDTFVVLETKR